MKRIFGYVLLAVILTSCLSSRKIINFQANVPIDTTLTVADSSAPYIPVIQPGDMLTIYVMSASPEVARFFNYSEQPGEQASMANCYIVDAHGMVRLPLIGFMEMAGLSTEAAHDSLTRKLEKYLLNPSVKLNIRNFRVTVMGEVLHPGVVTTSNEFLTLPEALAMAGDLTIYSKRSEIMIIREVNGKRTYGTVNFESREVFDSPYYLLHGNDIIYVPPLSTKKALAETWFRVIPVIFSGISLTMSVLAYVKLAK